MNIDTIFTVYIDRALTSASLEKGLVGEMSFDEWIVDAGDLERVQRANELASKLIKRLESETTGDTLLGNAPVSSFCYTILESDLQEFVLEYAQKGKAAPTDDEIIDFIMGKLPALQKEWTE